MGNIHKSKSVYFGTLYNFCLVNLSLKCPRGPEQAHGALLWSVAHGRGVGGRSSRLKTTQKPSAQ